MDCKTDILKLHILNKLLEINNLSADKKLIIISMEKIVDNCQDNILDINLIIH